MQAFYRRAWVQGQYRPVRAGVSCAAVRSGVHVLSTHRDMVAFGLYLHRDAGILSAGVGKASTGLCVQASAGVSFFVLATVDCHLHLEDRSPPTKLNISRFVWTQSILLSFDCKIGLGAEEPEY